MKPISPVVRGAEAFEIVWAKNQRQYQKLPALSVNDHSQQITRWRMTWRERLKALLYGDVYLWVSTFGEPLQPVLLTLERPVIQLPKDPTDWSMNEVAQKHGHTKQASATAIILLLLSGCAARKPITPKPDPQTYNVWVCAPKTPTDQPTCTQVIWPATVPDGATCQAVPGADSSEVIVCQLPATSTACCSAKACAEQHHHKETVQ